MVELGRNMEVFGRGAVENIGICGRTGQIIIFFCGAVRNKKGNLGLEGYIFAKYSRFKGFPIKVCSLFPTLLAKPQSGSLGSELSRATKIQSIHNPVRVKMAVTFLYCIMLTSLFCTASKAV